MAHARYAESLRRVLAVAALLAAGCSGKHAADAPPRAVDRARASAARPASPRAIRPTMPPCARATRATLTRIVGAARDPRPVIDRITAIAWSNPTASCSRTAT